jgi:hypothetical protein
MIFAAISAHLDGQLGSFSSVFVYAFVPLALFLVAFRIWKFTIRPLLHPDEPKELPYWVPYFGHTFAYVRSGHDVIMRAK